MPGAQLEISPRYAALKLKNATRKTSRVSVLSIMERTIFTFPKYVRRYSPTPPKVRLRARERGLSGMKPAQRRRCVVKLSFKNQGTRKDRIAANSTYLKYIGRESATLQNKPSYENASEGRQFYTLTPGGRKILMSQEEAENKLAGDQTFRIILSPEDESVDLDQLVQKFMYSSFWGVNGMGERTRGFVACNHYNTSHPHAHILVSRKSLRPEGSDELRVPPAYVKDFARSEASFICSCIAGPRSKREYLESERKKIDRQGLSSYDYLIKIIQKPEMTTNENGKKSVTRYEVDEQDIADRISPKLRKAVRRRLSYLSTHLPDVITKREGGYTLDKNWLKRLETSEFLNIAGLEERAKKEKIHIDNGADIFKPYSGVVRDISVADDFNEKVLLTIEDKEGRLHLLDYKTRLDEADKLRNSKVDVARKGRKATIVSRTLG